MTSLIYSLTYSQNPGFYLPRIVFFHVFSCVLSMYKVCFHVLISNFSFFKKFFIEKILFNSLCCHMLLCSMMLIYLHIFYNCRILMTLQISQLLHVSTWQKYKDYTFNIWSLHTTITVIGNRSLQLYERVYIMADLVLTIQTMKQSE